MKYTFPKVRIGLRTTKTVIAVIISMVVIDILGTSDSKLIFAMVGAMAAVQPTFKESITSCLSQIIGVVFGALCAVLLCALPLPSLVAVGIGITLVITLYNVLQIHYSPSLSCFILVLACTSPDVQPIAYSVARIWDTAIGLAIGMAINMLVFPYDNSQQVRASANSLETELMKFLEELFDGDEILPDVKQMYKTIAALERQLNIFSNQKFLLHRHEQHMEIKVFQACEEKARSLITHMEALCSMERPGRLNEENRQYLESCGAHIQDHRPLCAATERDIVTNYHVSQLLILRQELLEALEN